MTMNIKFSKIFTVFTFAFFFSCTHVVPSYSAEYVSVINDGVNVRTDPNTSSSISMELFAGYPLKVLETNGEWHKIIDFENDGGWIHSSLVQPGNTVIVNSTNQVNMRSGPGTSDAVVANIDRGVVLEVLERVDKWTKVKHLSGTQGWIYSPLLWP